QRGQKGETTGQAPQSQHEQGAQQDRGKQGQSQQRSQKQQQRDQTTGQSQRQQDQQAQPQRQQRDQTQGQAPHRQQGQQGQSGQQGQMGQQGQTGQQGQAQQGQAQQGQAQQGQAGGSVNLTTEQRTKIRQTVLAGGNVPRANNVNFSVSVGTVVPTRIHVVEVPSVIVDIHPQWRGFWYFVGGGGSFYVDLSPTVAGIA